MNPLGAKTGKIYSGTWVIRISDNKHIQISGTIHVLLISRRSNMYEFVHMGISYLVHADNVSLD